MKEAVLELLIHGSDVNCRNKIGLSPLHLAVQTCNQTSIEIIQALVTKGYNTDVNLPDGHGMCCSAVVHTYTLVQFMLGWLIITEVS